MPNDSEVSRRDFLKTGAKTSAGLAALSGITFITQPERVFGANDRVRVAVCGIRGQGFVHVREYSKMPNVEIAAVCDIDENVIGEKTALMDKMNIPKVKTYTDVRKLLEDKSVDAISIATPNHWHSLIGIWGCQAGKDVYVEKPCSHNWWEGRQLVAAAKKYDRIVQHGTNSRSGDAIIEAVQKMRDGLIGEIYLSRGLCYKWRDTIGRTPESAVPPGVHYDLWTGPAPLKPFTKNRFHYNWHWIWDTGNGEIGNQAIHEIDIARAGLGVGFPVQVSAIGGHFLFDDDQQTPNMLSANYIFETPDGKRKMMEIEVRGWITNHEAEIGTGAYGASSVPPAGLAAAPKPAAEKKSVSAAQQAASLGPKDAKTNTVGNIFYGSNGLLGIDGYDAYKTWLTDDVEPGPHGKASGDHYANFIDCVRSRDAGKINSPIEEAHISTTLVHLANASYRLGRTLKFDPATEKVVGDDEANTLLRGTYRAPYVVEEKI